jgi:hypothetical protein
VHRLSPGSLAPLSDLPPRPVLLSPPSSLISQYRYSDAMEMKQDCEALLNQGNHDLGAQIVSERQHWVSEGQRGLDDSKLFAVSASTEEYAQVSARFLASMPNATIVSVERVENGPMHEAFLLQASTLKKQIGADWDQDALPRHGCSRTDHQLCRWARLSATAGGDLDRSHLRRWNILRVNCSL